jgi:hypothetical protein
MGLTASTFETGRPAGAQTHDPSETREALLDIQPPAVRAQLGLLLEKAQLEHLELLAARAALQVVGSHKLETELRLVVLLAAGADDLLV